MKGWIIGIILIIIAASVFFYIRGKSAISGIKNYLGRADLPRGMRNNNPGNLRVTGIPWQGKIPINQNTDGAFEQFEEYKWGTRAMIKDLQNDIGKDGLNTIRKLIYEYAPPEDGNNDPENYINLLVDKTGLDENYILSTSNKSALKKIVMAIAEVENGVTNCVTSDDFEQAWALI